MSKSESCSRGDGIFLEVTEVMSCHPIWVPCLRGIKNRPTSRRDDWRPRGASHKTLNSQIRLRAYQLYEARGREDGYELDDWLHAEQEVT